MSEPAFFVTGGTLRQDAQSYVARKADAELLELLRAGEFCYVLTSRQMGKSSLMVRTAMQLREEGISIVVLDLTRIGQNLEVEQWYFSMLSHVGEQLRLEEEIEAYWDAHSREAPLDRFIGAIREVYLARKRKPLVIFVDEIDYVRSLKKFSADEFFAGIRECYTRRPEDPKMSRLTFCLLGVATPSDLIRDQRMTPFNIGRGIELQDFNPADAAVLADGLSPHRETAHLLLERVLSWTSGHPYLTQKLCAEVAKASAYTAASVDAVCAGIFLSAQARERDDNLHFVRERLLNSAIDRAALLDAYAKVRRGERLLDDQLHPLINELRLSGIVRIVDGSLKVRNRIYERVFDLKWTRDNLPDAEVQRQRAAYRRGIRRVVGLSLAVLTVMGCLAAGYIREGKRTKRLAVDARRLADDLAKEAKKTERQAEDLKRSNERWLAVNKEKLAQAAATETVLGGFQEMQKTTETMLGAIAPLFAQNSGSEILDRFIADLSKTSSKFADEPRIRIGEAGLRRAYSRLYLRLGRDDKAAEQARIATDLVQGELERAPQDNALQRQLFDCDQLIGESILGGRYPDAIRHKTASDYNKAIAVFQLALAVCDKAIAANPKDEEWRHLRLSTLITFGDVARLCDVSGDAWKRYREAEHDIESVHQQWPSDRKLEDLLATIYDRIGSLCLAEGRNKEALQQFDHGLAIRKGAPSDPQNEDLDRLSDLAISYNKLGNVFIEDGKWTEALAYHKQSLEIRRKLCDRSPRLEWQRNLGFSLYNVGIGLWKTGRNQEAVAMLTERLTKARALFENDKTNPNLTFDLSNGLYGLADILLNVGDKTLQNPDEALELAQDSVRLTERRDASQLALLAQCLRLKSREKEAYAVAIEAQNILPPAGKRNLREKEAALNISFELKRLAALARNPAGLRDSAPPASKNKGRNR